MEFVLTGFRQDNNVRRYTFQGIADDRKRSEFTVGVDLALVRKHRIPMQELPLLCRGLLEGRSEGEPSSAFMFTEKEMLGYATRRAAEQELAEQKRRGHHRPPLPGRAVKNGNPNS
jgi:hypothetical protein